jgi:hypothetical protein
MKLSKKKIKEMLPEQLKIIAGGVISSSAETQTSTDSCCARSNAEAESEAEHGNKPY